MPNPRIELSRTHDFYSNARYWTKWLSLRVKQEDRIPNVGRPHADRSDIDRVKKANRFVIFHRYNVENPAAPSRAFLKHTPNNEGIASNNQPTDRLVDQTHQRCAGLRRPRRGTRHSKQCQGQRNSRDCSTQSPRRLTSGRSVAPNRLIASSGTTTLAATLYHGSIGTSC